MNENDINLDALCDAAVTLAASICVSAMLIVITAMLGLVAPGAP